MKELNMLKKEEYLKTVRRPYPPLWGSFIFSGASTKRYYKPFLDTPFRLPSTIKSEEVWYYPKKATENCSILAFDYWMHPKNLKQSKRLFKELEEELIKKTKSNFKTLSKIYKKYIPALIMVWRCDQPVENRIKKLLTKKLPKKEAKELLNKLSIPLKDNFYKKEEVELVKTKDIEKHVNKYIWLNSRYGEDIPYTIQEAKKN